MRQFEAMVRVKDEEEGDMGSNPHDNLNSLGDLRLLTIAQSFMSIQE